MKITESDIIKKSEMNLIDSITGDLDWRAIESILKEKHNLGLQDDIQYRQGDIVIHNNQIAYKLDFDVKVTLSVLFDRKGNCVQLSTSGGGPDSQSTVKPSETVQQPADDAAEMDSSAEIPVQDEEPLDLKDAEITTNNVSDEKSEHHISQMASQIADMITEINEK